MEIALLSIFLVTWILMNIIILKSGMITNVPTLTPLGLGISPVDAAEMGASTRLRNVVFGLISLNTARELIRIFWRVIPANKYNILFQILILTAFLLLIFLGPHIQALNDAEKKTRKEFEEMADDTANESEKIGNNVFKQPWLDAWSERNRYYIMCFLMFSFIPFFYLFFSFWGSPNPPFHPSDPLTSLVVHNQIVLFHKFLLHLTAGFNGFVTLLYTIFSKKSWYFYFVPLVYLIVFFMADIGFGKRFRNYAASLLLLIWPFFYLSKSSILWSIPFFILVPLLFLAQ